MAPWTLPALGQFHLSLTLFLIRNIADPTDPAHTGPDEGDQPDGATNLYGQ